MVIPPHESHGTTIYATATLNSTEKAKETIAKHLFARALVDKLIPHEDMLRVDVCVRFVDMGGFHITAMSERNIILIETNNSACRSYILKDFYDFLANIFYHVIAPAEKYDLVFAYTNGKSQTLYIFSLYGPPGNIISRAIELDNECAYVQTFESAHAIGEN